MSVRNNGMKINVSVSNWYDKQYFYGICSCVDLSREPLLNSQAVLMDFRYDNKYA